jgi:hypothetical protein
MSLRVSESFTPVKSGSDKKTSQWPWTAKLLGQAVKKGIQEGKTQEEPKIFMCEPCNSLPHFTLLSPLPCCTGPRTPGSLPSPPSFLPPLHPLAALPEVLPGAALDLARFFARRKDGPDWRSLCRETRGVRAVVSVWLQRDGEGKVS